MTNYSAQILANAVSGLNAQQAVIATTANNISNVDTPGYARRTVDLETSDVRAVAGSLPVGDGVQVGTVQRISSSFVDGMVQSATSDSNAANSTLEYLNQMQQSFNLTGTGSTIGDALASFYTAANTLSGDPSSIDLRDTFLQSAQTLASSVSTTYNQVATLQTQADQQIQTEVSNVNSIITKIGQLNGQIQQSAGTGQQDLDAQDQMSTLLNQLSGEMNYNLVTQSNGSVQISLSNGFTLVNGTNVNKLSTTTSPSFNTGGASSLAGGQLSYIVYDYSGGANTQDVDLTSQITGGTIGGLLSARGVPPAPTTPNAEVSAFDSSGSLVQVASQVESIAETMVTGVNNTYNNYATNPAGPPYVATATDLQGNLSTSDVTPNSPFSLFTATAPSGTTITDTTGNGNATTNDVQNFLTTNNITNIASYLTVAISDPTKVAAGTTGAPGDGSNMANLAATQTSGAGLVKVGNYAPVATQSLEDGYDNTVTTVSNLVQTATLNQSVTSGNLTNAQSQQSSVEGVSLDEEFTNLIESQNAYQASAKMLSTGSSLLDDLMKSL